MKQDKKVKTINLDAELHEELKNFCHLNSYKINLFVERLISKAIRSQIEQQKITTRL